MLTKEEADKVGGVLVQAVGTLALLYRLKDAGIKQPFASNVDEAYDAFTPEVRELLVKAIWGENGYM